MNRSLTTATTTIVLNPLPRLPHLLLHQYVALPRDRDRRRTHGGNRAEHVLNLPGGRGDRERQSIRSPLHRVPAVHGWGGVIVGLAEDASSGAAVEHRKPRRGGPQRDDDTARAANRIPATNGGIHETGTFIGCRLDWNHDRTGAADGELRVMKSSPTLTPHVCFVPGQIQLVVLVSHCRQTGVLSARLAL